MAFQFPFLRRSMLRVLLFAPFAFFLATAVGAAERYPDHPIRLVVPFSAGGTVDFVARLVARQLGTQLGGQVVVENLPGAGGTIASSRVAKADKDGYTLLFTTPNHTINPALYQRMSFDTERDLAPVSLVAQIPELLVANAAQPYQDFKGFLAYAKEHQGALNYGSAGNGTLPHVTMELLLQRLHVQITHVPYKGAAPAMNDLLAGQVGVKMDTIATSAQYIQSGKLKPLAIASLKRSPLMPEVPTLDELGVPGYQGILWMGILAPAGTPQPVIQKLHVAMTAVTQNADFRKRLDADGVEVVGGDPAAFGKLIRAEIGQWAEVIRKSKIKVD
ncbi:MAG: tripartite tricarboxylate transporter substrate binding protein [Ottowia sp.]|uniref:Bug family tripartite tricarboxylate transporter substrate binding protein n=1 Tax=Ottowia sp. TaxID=1898956 RepID=UPI003C760114